MTLEETLEQVNQTFNNSFRQTRESAKYIGYVCNLLKSPEIPLQSHLHIINGVLARAFEKQDNKTDNAPKASKYLFAYCLTMKEIN